MLESSLHDVEFWIEQNKTECCWSYLLRNDCLQIDHWSCCCNLFHLAKNYLYIWSCRV